MTQAELTDAAAVAAAAMRDALEPAGWRVTTIATTRTVSISVDHDLTAPTSFNFDNDDRDHTAFIKRSLRHPEFDVVARAPQSTPHAALLKSLRAAAFSYTWGSETLAILGALLASHEALTAEEGDWLAESGPAWFEPPAQG